MTTAAVPSFDPPPFLDEPRPLSAPDGHSVGFGLFLVVNAALFIRPGELVPALEGWPVYNIAMAACVLASAPVLVRQFRWASLRSDPGTPFVVGLLPVIALSRLRSLDLHGAWEGGVEFLKVIVYYLLLIGLLSSFARLRLFLVATVAFVSAMAVIAMLKYHGYIHLDTVAVIAERRFASDGSLLSANMRLQATGIFGDPNDFSLVLVTVMLVITHVLLTRGGGLLRVAVLAVLPVSAYALFLTRSRGGFLALVVGVCTFFVARVGARRAVLPLALVLPVLLVVFGGRATTIDVGEDTAQGRVQLWRASLQVFRASPLFGTGYHRLPEEIGLVSHNSYVHAFAELGIVGGILFASAVLLPLAVVWRLGKVDLRDLHPEADHWRTCVFAIGLSYAAGIWSLSRVYELPTYFVLGLTAAYCRRVGADVPGAVPAFDWRVVRRALGVGLGTLAFFYVFVRVFARSSG